MTSTDQNVFNYSAVALAIGGFAGGAKSWAGAADGLPFIIFAFALPALGVWFGRRAADINSALKKSAFLGAAFVLPSFLLYRARDFSENFAMVALAVSIPVVFAAIAFATRNQNSADEEDVKSARQTAKNMKLMSLAGIILFPQIAQPIALDYVLKITAAAKESGDKELNDAVNLTRRVSQIVLALLTAMIVLSILAAVSDAF